MAFCQECGAVIDENADYCNNCMPKTNAAQTGLNDSSLSITGDKNVYAGDVVGKQENIKITGNATVIRNEDETKKMVTCHVCGHGIIVGQSFKCPECGMYTCEICYDKTHRLCISCVSKKQFGREAKYIQKFLEFYEDQMISGEERQQLQTLQKTLGLSDERVRELERAEKSKAAENSVSVELTMFAKRSFDRALDDLYVKDNYQAAYETLYKLYKEFPQNEDVFTSYLYAAVKVKPEEARDVIQKNLADTVPIHLALIDLDIESKQLNTIERRINKALRFWNGNLLINCRKILYMKAIYDEYKDEEALDSAKEILTELPEPKNKLEKLYLQKVKMLLEQALPKKEAPAPAPAPAPARTPKTVQKPEAAPKPLRVQEHRTAPETRNQVESVKVPERKQQSSPQVAAVQKFEFSPDKRTLIACPKNITSYTIPVGVTFIGNEAFLGCEQLSKVTIPDTVTEISGRAFEGCISLRQVTIPESVIRIGERAFHKCSSLETIELPSKLTNLGNGAFSGCSKLERIKIPESVIFIGDEVLSSCSSLKAALLPQKLTKISKKMFSNCSSLTNIVLPRNVHKIDEHAFEKCENLINIFIPIGVKSIGNFAFFGCRSLKNLTLPKTIETIGDNCFAMCNSLLAVIIPSAQTIGNFAFRSCVSLKEITIPATVTSIGDYAFHGCAKLTIAKVPASTVLGESAFQASCRVQRYNA